MITHVLSMRKNCKGEFWHFKNIEIFRLITY